MTEGLVFSLLFMLLFAHRVCFDYRCGPAFIGVAEEVEYRGFSQASIGVNPIGVEARLKFKLGWARAS